MTIKTAALAAPQFWALRVSVEDTSQNFGIGIGGNYASNERQIGSKHRPDHVLDLRREMGGDLWPFGGHLGERVVNDCVTYGTTRNVERPLPPDLVTQPVNHPYGSQTAEPSARLTKWTLSVAHSANVL